MRLGRSSDNARALRSVSLLRDLGKSELEQVAGMTYRISREPGEVVLRQGDIGTELLVLIEGTARVERDGQTVADVHPQTVIGEMALIDQHRRSATVIATTSCELLAVPYDKFWDFVNRVPSVQRQLLITLSRRVRDLEGAPTG